MRATMSMHALGSHALQISRQMQLYGVQGVGESLLPSKGAEVGGASDAADHMQQCSLGSTAEGNKLDLGAFVDSENTFESSFTSA